MTQSTWTTLLVAGIPALASMVAAVIAGVFAVKTRRADTEAQRARDLESRISERKYDVYQPMINLLSDVLGNRQPNEKELSKKLQDFSTWITIYGSDEGVESFHNFMQAVYHNPPPQVLLRLLGDFMIAARKDMGTPNTSVHREHLLGMRITDIYTQFDIIDQSFEEICDRLGWQAPWLSPDVTPRHRGLEM